MLLISPSPAQSAQLSGKEKINRKFNIRRAAVLGAGTMGARIAAHIANAGLPVFLLDIVPEKGDRNALATQAVDNLKRSEEHTSELQSLRHLVCRLRLEKKNTHPIPGAASTPAFNTLYSQLRESQH